MLRKYSSKHILNWEFSDNHGLLTKVMDYNVISCQKPANFFFSKTNTIPCSLPQNSLISTATKESISKSSKISRKPQSDWAPLFILKAAKEHPLTQSLSKHKTTCIKTKTDQYHSKRMDITTSLTLYFRSLAIALSFSKLNLELSTRGIVTKNQGKPT